MGNFTETEMTLISYNKMVAEIREDSAYTQPVQCKSCNWQGIADELIDLNSCPSCMSARGIKVL